MQALVDLPARTLKQELPAKVNLHLLLLAM
jgi:hypothetical protein